MFEVRPFRYLLVGGGPFDLFGRRDTEGSLSE
jgi:hypothetical protein